ncbi:MAG: PLP-dependent aminotransferase family protein [Acidobacteria bacterium]|nr:PLP-dependent aminotransferase family protein [Acidobacteriota bacterium]
MFIYEDLAERVADHIRRGDLKPGERVPSLRKMSRVMGVSMTSAMRAYGMLEDRGMIESRPKSGYFVRLLPSRIPRLLTNTAESSTCAVDKGRIINDFMETLHDPRFLHFGCASPHPTLLPLQRVANQLSRVARRDPNRMMNYVFPPGGPALRRQIALHGLNHQCRFTAEDVLITNGCMEALYLSLKGLTQPGDHVLIESPTYFNVLQLLDNLGLKAVVVPAHPNTGVDIKQLAMTLEKQPIKAILLVPSFNNPLGCSVPQDERSTLVKLAVRHRVPIIEDDVYGDLYLEGERPKPLKSFDTDGWVILCSSFSKTLAPGLRVGYAVSERFRDSLKQVQFMSTLAPATPTQETVAAFIQSGHYQRHLKKLRQQLKGLLAQFTAQLERCFPEGTRIAHPLGGFVLWLALPNGTDSFKLFDRAKQYQISFVPGPLFSPRDEYRNCIRLTYAHPFDDTVKSKIQLLGQLCTQSQ